MRVLQGIAEAAVWLATVALLLLPALVAVDRGGVLHWTQYAIAWAVMPIAAVSLLALIHPHDRVPVRGLAILAPLSAIAAFAWFQTVPLPPVLANVLAGGTQRVIDQWLTPIAGPAASGAIDAVSISPIDTSHAAAMLTLLLPIALAASLMMRTRARLVTLLLGLAIFGASVAVLGIYRQSVPDGWTYLMDASYPFGGFVNRNNAALALNLGLAASLGILAWRMVAIHDVELDDPQNDWGDVLGLIHDQTSLLAGLCGGLCVAGLLVCGSRGGLVGAMAGALLATGYVRTRRGLVISPVICLFLAAAAALLFAPFELPWLSVQRLGDSGATLGAISQDGRWMHWRDGWEAAMAHLPAGSGVSTYAYAYLPHQKHSPNAWFEHADNLWLEIFVETGVFGILLVVGAIGLWGWSLHRLIDSPDPVDQGIRVAGWYAIASLAVTQFFDFGLMLPANHIAVVILAAAAISRASAVGSPISLHHESHHQEGSDDEGRPRLRLQTAARRRRRWGLLTLITASVLIAGGAASLRLRQDAQAEYAFTLIREAHHRVRFDDAKLRRLAGPAIAAVERRSYPAVQRWLAELWIDRGRLLETLESGPATVAQFQRNYDQREPFKTTLPYDRSDRPEDAASSAMAYRAAEGAAIAGLCACPLSPRFRDLLIALHRTTGRQQSGRDLPTARRTARCITQLMRFYNHDATRLSQLGDRAMVVGLPTVAARGYAAAIERQPQMTGQLLQSLVAAGYLQFGGDRSAGRLRLLDVLPLRSEPMRQAAVLVIDRPDVDPAFFEAASRTIACDAPTAAQRAECEILLARLAKRLNDPTIALARYRKAIWLQPANASYRLTMVELLDSLGRRREADAAIREALTKVDDRSTFEAILKKREGS